MIQIINILEYVKYLELQLVQKYKIIIILMINKLYNYYNKGLLLLLFLVKIGNTILVVFLFVLLMMLLIMLYLLLDIRKILGLLRIVGELDGEKMDILELVEIQAIIVELDL